MWRRWVFTVCGDMNNVTAISRLVFLPKLGGRVIGSTLWSHVPDEEIGRYNEMLAADGLQGVDNIRFDGRATGPPSGMIARFGHTHIPLDAADEGL
jgi:hypothetical protein